MSLIASSKLLIKHPMVRGMMAYSALWPTGCVINEVIIGKRFEDYDWVKCRRFCLYGGFFVAPTLYAWVKFAGKIFPGNNLQTAITKALVEQITYGPFASCSFFFVMSYLDHHNFQMAKDEVAEKFLPTYKVGACVWPVMSTINFYLIPERNRVPFISLCSLMWTTFLAYMKNLDKKEVPDS